MPDVSPTKWHRGHTTWFFETFLLESGLTGYDVFDLEFRYLFNSYYETIGLDILARNAAWSRDRASRRSGLPRARRCRHGEADRLLRERVARRLPARRTGPAPRTAAQELLLMDIKHVLSCNPLEPAYVESSVPIGHNRQPMRFVNSTAGSSRPDTQEATSRSTTSHRDTRCISSVPNR